MNLTNSALRESPFSVLGQILSLFSSIDLDIKWVNKNVRDVKVMFSDEQQRNTCVKLFDIKNPFLNQVLSTKRAIKTP